VAPVVSAFAGITVAAMGGTLAGQEANTAIGINAVGSIGTVVIGVTADRTGATRKIPTFEAHELAVSVSCTSTSNKVAIVANSIVPSTCAEKDNRDGQENL
jgi:hypothetical protein